MNKIFLEGIQAYKEGRYDDAVMTLKRVSTENPNNSNYLFYLGSSQAQNNQPEEAVKTFSRALEITDAIPIRYMRGEIYLNSEKQDKALMDFNYIINCKDEDNQYWKALSFLGRGLIYLEKGDIEMALNDFTGAEKIAQENEDISLHVRITETLDKNGF